MSDEQKPPAMCTTSGEPVEKVRAEQTEKTGQHKAYIVLSPDERAKGFVRPYRDAYKHVGPKICGRWIGHTSDATVCYMDPGHAGECGDAKGPRPQPCNTVTTMGRALSETYARDPKFYGSTFCVNCNKCRSTNSYGPPTVRRLARKGSKLSTAASSHRNPVRAGSTRG